MRSQLIVDAWWAVKRWVLYAWLAGCSLLVLSALVRGGIITAAIVAVIGSWPWLRHDLPYCSRLERALLLATWLLWLAVAAACELGHADEFRVRAPAAGPTACAVCGGRGACCGIEGGSGWRRKGDRQCVGRDRVERDCGSSRERCDWVGCLYRPDWRKRVKD